MNTIVVLQSNYIPWKGYFDLIHDADTFIFYDDLQYTKNDWRNRNKVKGINGPEWITIPVGADPNRLICDVSLTDSRWQVKHWKTILNLYSKSPYFKEYQPFFENVYLETKWANLSALNQHLIKEISQKFLGIKTKFIDSREFSLTGKKQDRLLDLLKQASATHYISGPSAQDYIDHEDFKANNIELIWKDYAGYPEYGQRFPPFSHAVSVIDLLFNTGPDAPMYIWGWRDN